ncbi:hypothetical protein Lal_00004642 [Lupinus albus]|uniref:Uncharacterized protein n=1 Tax=Lupinus albus TaxID=3870 RepID=A0A6A4NB92_LUPAL|nr:hypothetical protein Lalb_Chr23g0267021 [Lupinus albus]KAF1865268.1 hypothetical protein Lal_00004642 [Lupinus albus]
MEAHHHHQKKKENNVENEISEGTELKQEKEEQALKFPALSSPCHEFSFTNSLHSSSTTNFVNSKASLPSLALDLSPADDIFFHGHLLPLHLLSHLPSSPRFSTNSYNSLLEYENHSNNNGCSSNSNNIVECNIIRTKEESKSKPTFSLFGLVRGHKGCQVLDKEDKEKHKRRLGFEVINAIKRYLQIVQPLVLFRGRREKVGLQKQSYSHSGNLIRRNKPELMGRKGGYSAPASMRTSQTNSSLLLATKTLPPHNDSTMEELQAAIQAAIAHCKSSVAREHKC